LNVSEFRFQLMDLVKFVAAGETGRVKGRAEFMTGRREYQVQICGRDENGFPRKKVWLGENLLELVSRQKGPGASEHVSGEDEHA
jgi:hypothetical protein